MKLFFGLQLLLCFLSDSAQNSLDETVKQQLVKEWERAKAYTKEYLDAMPADKYNSRASDSIRSFSEQMLHLSQANAAMALFATDVQDARLQKLFFKPNFEKISHVQSKDSVIYYVTTSYDIMINAIRNLDFGKIEEVVAHDLPGGKRSANRLAWILKAFEHQTHHRGQCTIYLRFVGARPPAEKLW